MKFPGGTYALILLTSVSCSKDLAINNIKPIKKNYLHLSHTRTDSNPEVDSAVKKINLKKYDLLFLGGDLAVNSSADSSSIESLDSIFMLKSLNTFWAIGNHDDTNIGLIESYTGRNSYYTSTINNICFVVLNTELDSSSITGQQLSFFNSIVDTIGTVSHLVLFHHKLMWMYNHPVLESEIEITSNAPLDNCSYCLNPNNFNSTLYPELTAIKERGIEVLCIGGDIGKKAKKFEYLTNEGIYFLASGIDANKPGNLGLVLEHDITNQKLNWRFELIEKL